jgi:hypothetical protein
MLELVLHNLPIIVKKTNEVPTSLNRIYVSRILAHYFLYAQQQHDPVFFVQVPRRVVPTTAARIS